MIKLIVGVKGTGKTKTLIDRVNTSAQESKGSVICIEKGDKLNLNITYKARLVDVKAFHISGATALYGFVAGMLASNSDITDIYIDSVLKMCGDNIPDFEKFALEIDALTKDINCQMTVSCEPDALPASLAGFVEHH